MPDEDGSGVSTAQPDVRLLAEVFAFVLRDGEETLLTDSGGRSLPFFVYSREYLSV